MATAVGTGRIKVKFALCAEHATPERFVEIVADKLELERRGVEE